MRCWERAPSTTSKVDDRANAGDLLEPPAFALAEQQKAMAPIMIGHRRAGRVGRFFSVGEADGVITLAGTMFVNPAKQTDPALAERASQPIAHKDTGLRLHQRHRHAVTVV